MRNLMKWTFILALLLTQLSCETTSSKKPIIISGRPMAAVDNGSIADIFGRLRSPYLIARSAYWRAVGGALQTLGTLEGASYNPESGVIILRGKPASGNGPFHLDDLMTALRATLFEKESLGMTIDPDPKNPLGPTMPVRYFAGCQNTALGWVLFECDRLMKSMANGEDNLSHAPIEPPIPGFHNMLQLGVSLNNPNKNEWNRFWLTTDLLEGPSWREKPESSNRYQPVVFVTDDGNSINFVRCQLYVRTEVMKLTGGKLEKSPGKASKAAEYFANHLSAHFEEYAREYPVFARAAALARLVVLAEWIEKSRIPMDIQFIRNYRAQVPVITPTTTKSGKASYSVSHRVSGGVEQLTVNSYGGVDFQPRTFFASDIKGVANRERELVQDDLGKHRSEISWDIQTEDGPNRFVVIPTVNTASSPNTIAMSERSERIERENIPSQGRKKQITSNSPPAAHGETKITKSDQVEKNNHREKISVKGLDEIGNPPARGPPEIIAQSDRVESVEREPIALKVRTPKTSRKTSQGRKKQITSNSPPAVHGETKITKSDQMGERIHHEKIAFKGLDEIGNPPARGPPEIIAQSDRVESVEREPIALQFRTPKITRENPSVLLGDRRRSQSPKVKERKIESLSDLVNAREETNQWPGPPQFVLTDQRAELAGLKVADPRTRAKEIFSPFYPMPEGFSPHSERAERIERENLSLTQTKDKPWGMNLIQIGDSRWSYDIPRLVAYKSPRVSKSIGIKGQANSRIVVADSLMLVSETGNIAIQFDSPEIDQKKSLIYYPPASPHAGGIIGYYPKTRILEFADRSRIQFNERGFPTEVTLYNSNSNKPSIFAFKYSPKRTGRRPWPEPVACRVISDGNRAVSGVYRLVNAPRKN